MPLIIPTHDALDPKEIDQFESRFAIRLPAEYRQFLIAHNGGRPVPDRFDTEDGKVESMVVRFFPVCDLQEYALEDEYIELTLNSVIPSNFLSIAIDPAENRVLLSCSGDDQGCVYYWSWDEEPDPASCSYDYMRRIAPSFDTFLAKLR